MAGPQGLNRTGRATILDVAAAAGVSRQTVTRAMNGMAGISAATKERVLAAAEALGYRPSRFGRGLVLGGERQLGLVVDDLRNPYSPELAAAVVRAAGAQGWTVMLADVALAADADRSVVALGEQTDAVVGYLGERAADWVGLLGSVPVVELDPAGPVAWGAVHLDPTAAVEELAEHLVRSGVRRPVVLDTAGGPSPRAVLQRRALASRGVDAALVHAAASTAAAAGAVLVPLLDAPERPDAVLAFNDVMALGVLAACRRAGLDVPGDVRVSGIDGLPLGALLAPSLSTLAVDFAAVAEAALELAADDPTGSRTIAHRLLLRESA